VYDATTYTQFATWAAHTIRCRWLKYGYSKRVKRSLERWQLTSNRRIAA